MTIRLRLHACLGLFVMLWLVLPSTLLAQTASFTTLHSFADTDGASPRAPLIQASDGNYYGTAENGGSNNCEQGCGTVFKITPSGAFATLYTFCSQAGCPDGEYPYGGLIEGSDGNLYGTTFAGGQYAGGTAFRLTTAGTLTTLYSFCSQGGADTCLDGAEPAAGLVQGSDGNYYGTTANGGSNGIDPGGGEGTIFKLTPTGTLTTLFSFYEYSEVTAGLVLQTPLVQGTDGFFYGSTVDGDPGSDAGGTIFNFNYSGTFNALYTFPSGDPTAPGGGLVEYSNGLFYGAATDGEVFTISGSREFSTVYTFEGYTDGAQPESGVVLGSDGNFYGTTYLGGANTSGLGNGVTYQLTPAGTETPLYSFCSQTNCADGEYPIAGLAQGSDGSFYGTTYEGGSAGYGTVFKFTMSPALSGPVQLNFSNSSVESGSPVTLSWKVMNGFSTTLQQCYAFVQGGFAAAGAWTGLQTGTITGGVYAGSATITPTDGGVYTYALTCGGMESGFATLTVDGGALSVTTGSLPSGNVSGAYSQPLVAQGGTPPYMWSLSSGSLPAGLSLNASTGVISGTPTATGTENFVVKVTDSESKPATATASLGITVYPAELTITTTSLPKGTIGSAYSTTINAVSGTQPYYWFVYSGSLPAGLSLGASTGIISGTPTTYGTSSFIIEVEDSSNPQETATATLSITINPQQLAITTTSVPSGLAGAAYSAAMSAVGGVTPYSWTISAGSLPAGLSINTTTGLISGAPTIVGTFSFTVKVTDSEPSPQTSTANFSITVIPALKLTTTSLPAGIVGADYATTLSASGGTPPYTWSLNAGNLPAGLSLAAATGVISGTPTSAATSNFTVLVTDNAGYTASVNLSITINPATPKIVTTVLGTGDVGTALATTLSAVGGVAPYAWSVSAGTLPAGLKLASSTGVLAGTPTTAATSSFTVEVKDGASNTTTQALSMTIYGSTIVRVTTTSLAAGTVGTAYSQTLAAYSGTKPYTWSVGSGTLPVGLSLNASTGVISGTPTAAGAAPILIHVKGSGNNVAGANLSIAINSTLTVLTTVLPTAAVGTSYSFTAAASGGVGAYAWSVSSGALPAGLSLNASTGVISGKPTTAETSSFTLKATDSDGNVAQSSLSVTVYGTTIVRITTTSLAGGTVGTAYSATLAATSGTKPYVWNVYSGSLPPGLTLNASTGIISGTPTTAGTSDFFIAVKGSGNNTATANLSITIVQ